jgi:hypothetical protein
MRESIQELSLQPLCRLETLSDCSNKWRTQNFLQLRELSCHSAYKHHLRFERSIDRLDMNCYADLPGIDLLTTQRGSVQRGCVVPQLGQ